MNQRLLRESVTLREVRHAFFLGGVGELSFEMVFNSTIRLSHKFVKKLKLQSQTQTKMGPG